MGFERGPHLQVAVLCEQLLQEKDGVLSVIRMVDRVTVEAHGSDAPAEMPSFALAKTMLVTIKAGDIRGTHELSVKLALPSGEIQPVVTRTVLLEGEADRGVNIVLGLQNLQLTQQGLHWFQVFFDGQLLATLPLRVAYLRLLL